MASNILDNGNRMTVIAPSGGVVSNALLVTGNTFGIALANAASGENVAVAVGVTARLRCTNAVSTSIVQGGLVYWDATNSNATNSATSNRLIGISAVAKANTDTSILVRLNPSFT
jgi:predicted RecA/RadA family phage recombinase